MNGAVDPRLERALVAFVGRGGLRLGLASGSIVVLGVLSLVTGRGLVNTLLVVGAAVVIAAVPLGVVTHRSVQGPRSG